MQAKGSSQSRWKKLYETRYFKMQLYEAQARVFSRGLLSLVLSNINSPQLLLLLFSRKELHLECVRRVFNASQFLEKLES